MAEQSAWKTATFEHFVAARGTAMLRTVVFLAGDPHTGEDLLQDVLLRSYQRWRRIDDPAEVIDCSPGSVKTHSARGLARLRAVPGPESIPWRGTAPMADYVTRVISASGGDTTGTGADEPGATDAAEITRFELHLREVMASVSKGIRPPAGLAIRVIDCGRRRRAVAVVLPQTVREKDARMLPADPVGLSPPLDSTYGVDVHWLPDNFGVLSRQGQNFEAPGPLRGQFGVTTSYSRLPITEKAFPEHGEHTPRGPAHTVDVRRGLVVDLEATLQWRDETLGQAGRDGHERTSTAVGSHAAYLSTSDDILGKPRYSLCWSPDPTVVVTVAGASLADVRKIAESLVVGPAPRGPRDWEQSARVDSAFYGAFTTAPGMAPRPTLDRVEGGDDLRAAMDEAQRTNRESVESRRVRSLGPVVFLSETEAMVVSELDMRVRENGVMVDSGLSGVVRVILTADGWKVRQLDYCGMLMRVLTCPPITVS